MTKRSGFAVTIKAFFPARANDPEHMAAAMDEISGLLNSISESGRVLDVQQRFMLSKDTPDDPAALAQEQVEERAAQGDPHVHVWTVLPDGRKTCECGMRQMAPNPAQDGPTVTAYAVNSLGTRALMSDGTQPYVASPEDMPPIPPGPDRRKTA